MHEVFDNPFPYDFENPDCNPFAFGGIDWCGFTPDADELRWQARVRDEKLDEGGYRLFSRGRRDGQYEKVF